MRVFFVILNKTNVLLPVIACGFICNVYKGARITKKGCQVEVQEGFVFIVLVLLQIIAHKRNIKDYCMKLKKTIMSLAVVSVLLSGSAVAALNNSGQADNSASTATLNFTGKVTSSLCQVNTSDLTKTISLGDVSAAQLKNNTGRAPSHSFSVGLTNCDPTVSNITYVIRDGNSSPEQGQAQSAYLIPKSDDTSAKGVGVYIADPKGNAIQIGENKNFGVVKDENGALSEQNIALTAYIGTASGAAANGDVFPGDVNAVGIMTIKAAAAE